ncbi:MAG TPA: TIM barrel protein [Methanothrix soehngenii]|jgi:sugar phosphate isomerase/epimerase|uniref:sugar phosphate isomerase/epimerase family protein n=1 Tax=Methanothrix soehngenii TaxID=2223 RepID=UPI002D1C41D9|nr:TIM barrel protein [Methanothrix soehngenii]HOI20119.1 TIM barrel protein [Methanothrix soehngenii]
MNLSISNIAWDVQEDDVIASLMQQTGIMGLEIAPGKIKLDLYKLDDADIKRYKNYWLSKDIKIAAMQSLLFGHPEMKIFYDETSREITLGYLKYCINIGIMVGAKAFIFGSPINRYIPDESKDLSNDIAADFFNKLGDYCHKNNAVFCLEPNPVEYGTNFLCNTKAALDFVKEVDNCGLKINIDTGTMIMNNEDYREVMEKSLSYAGHIHISEPFLNPIDQSRRIYAEIAEILKESSYSGRISIEMKALSRDQNAKNIEKALIFVKNTFA